MAHDGAIRVRHRSRRRADPAVRRHDRPGPPGRGVGRLVRRDGRQARDHAVVGRDRQPRVHGRPVRHGVQQPLHAPGQRPRDLAQHHVLRRSGRGAHHHADGQLHLPGPAARVPGRRPGHQPQPVVGRHVPPAGPQRRHRPGRPVLRRCLRRDHRAPQRRPGAQRPRPRVRPRPQDRQRRRRRQHRPGVHGRHRGIEVLRDLRRQPVVVRPGRRAGGVGAADVDVPEDHRRRLHDGGHGGHHRRRRRSRHLQRRRRRRERVLDEFTIDKCGEGKLVR